MNIIHISNRLVDFATKTALRVHRVKSVGVNMPYVTHLFRVGLYYSLGDMII